MIVFIDKNHKCHTTEMPGFKKADIAAFDRKCEEYIEGYCCLMEGEEATIDGVAYHGEMLWPWEDYRLLASLQAQYEKLQTAMERAYQEGVNSI